MKARMTNDLVFYWLMNQKKRIVPILYAGIGIDIYFKDNLIRSYKATSNIPNNFVRINLDPKYKPDDKFVQSCCYQVGKEKYLGKEFIDLYPDIKDKWANRLKNWIKMKLK